MQWLAENWVWIVVFIVFVGMHMFGHGGHGGRGGHGGHGGGGRDEPRRPADKDEQGKDRPQGHQH